MIDRCVLLLTKFSESIKIAFNSAIGTALVHFYPPKHHPRALGVIETVLSQDPINVSSILARAYVLRYAGKYEEARKLFSQGAKLILGHEPTQTLLRLEAEEEIAWCTTLLGQYDKAANALRTIIGALDGFEGYEERKAQAWWRLGRTLWDQNG